jgi:hypothetical protein
MRPERVLSVVYLVLDELPGLGLSREVLEAIERGNAERLFPRFRV